MNDLSPVLLAACGFLFVCVGLLVVLTYLLLRFAGGRFLTPLMGLFSGEKDEDHADNSEEHIHAPRRPLASSRDIRARAQSLDFDSAVQRYQHQSGQPPAPPQSLGTTQQAPLQQPPMPTTPAPGTLEPNRPSLRNRPRTGQQDSAGSRNLQDRRRGDEEDDMLGGILSNEEDGDGLF